MDDHILWMVPILVLVVGLWRPQAGLLGLAAALPLFGTPPGGPYLGILDAAGAAGILVGLRARWTGESRSAGESSDALRWPVAAWVLASLAALVPLVYRPPAWRASVLWQLLLSLPDTETTWLLFSWRTAERLLIGLGLYWSYRYVFRGRSLRPVARALAVGIGCLVLLGVGEQTGLISLAGYRSIGEEVFDERMHSLFFHSGWLAQYLVLATPFAVAGLLAGGRVSRLSGLSLVALAPLAMALTQQRGAWLTMLVQVVALAALLGHRELRSRKVVAIGIVAVVTAILGVALAIWQDAHVFDALAQRFTDVSLSGRLPLWKRCYDLMAARNFLGSGLGTFAVAYEGAFPCHGAVHCWLTAHSLYIHTLFERGVAGLMALLLLLGVALGRLRSTLDEAEGERRMLALGLTVSLVGAATYGFVQYVFFLENLEWLCWILLACVSLIGAGPLTDRAAIGFSRWAAIAVAALALVSIPLRQRLNTTPTAQDQASFGFHSPETQSTGRVLRWTTWQAVERLPWKSETLVVELADGHPRAGERGLEVTLALDGRELWRGPVGSTWQSVRLDAGEPEKRSIVLRIRPSSTFRPSLDFRRDPELSASRDIRSLGVAVGRIYWQGLVLDNRYLKDSAVFSHPYSISIGNLGNGRFVVRPGGHLELRAPTVAIFNGFKVEPFGELVAGNAKP